MLKRNGSGDVLETVEKLWTERPVEGRIPLLLEVDFCPSGDDAPKTKYLVV